MTVKKFRCYSMVTEESLKSFCQGSKEAAIFE